MKYVLALSLSACAVDGVVLVVPSVEAGAEQDAAGAEQDAAADAYIDLDAQPDAEEASMQDALPMTVGSCRIAGASDGFYESFPDGTLDARWLIADGPTSLATFRRENVAIVDSTLVLTATPGAAAAIATRDLFASATYQVQGQPADGVELAVWWRRDEQADGTLDIATPGEGDDFTRVRMRSRDGAASSETQFTLAAPLNDGNDHTLRFDRYTTGTPAVRFWVDDEPRWETNEHLPSQRAGRMWIVATGDGVVRITNAFVTPFGNDGDACTDGELRGPGLLAP